jgi:quercetin dioxygenase-like cupin family protein
VIFSRSDLRYLELPGRRSADPLEAGSPDGFSMRVVRLDGNDQRSPHRHPHSQEVIYVVRGEGVLWEDGNRQRIGAGDCALIDSGVAHGTIPDPDTTMDLVCFFPHPDLQSNTEEIPDVILNRGTTES